MLLSDLKRNYECLVSYNESHPPSFSNDGKIFIGMESDSNACWSAPAHQNEK